MKKLSAVMLAAMCLTVGGVYATWTYAQDGIATEQGIWNPIMAEADTDNSMGKITINTEGLTVKVDSAATSGENMHKAKLIFEGQIDVTFTPTDGAPDKVMSEGIVMTYTLSCTDSTTWTYDNKAIITVKDDAVTTVSETERCFSFTITANDLANIFQIGDFTLDTYQEYLDFQVALRRGNIKLVVSHVAKTEDGVVTTTPTN